MTRSLRLVVALLTMSTALAAKAESVCPWLNQATASGLVGKEMSKPEISGLPPDITCAFHSRIGSEITDLTIQVVQMNDFSREYGTYKGRCVGERSALRAIGSEADICSADILPSTRGERIVGRVRDRAYVVTVTTNQSSTPSSNRNALENQVRAVADQVVGILF